MRVVTQYLKWLGMSKEEVESGIQLNHRRHWSDGDPSDLLK